jgi:23S rRNA pseudouridine1911/1915/1917 synthase
MPASLHVLYEDNHLLAVVKPAGLATMGVRDEAPSLLARSKTYIKERYGKPGNVYLGVVSRLDAPVSGVVVFARTSKAAARLSKQFRERSVEKTYWALVEGRIEPTEAVCEDWLAKDEQRERMRVVGPGFPGASAARLSYRRLSTTGSLSLVEVRLETGRKHQIRVQLSARGWPVIGDRKYGSRRAFAQGIALHARRLALVHPVRNEPIELVAPMPAAWQAFGITD